MEVLPFARGLPLSIRIRSSFIKISSLCAEIGLNFLHACALRNVEGAAAVAVPAADAVLCAVLKRQIVLLREAVAEARQIVILIDKADIQPDRAGLAVLAVDALALGILRRERADAGIVTLLGGGLKEVKTSRNSCSLP